MNPILIANRYSRKNQFAKGWRNAEQGRDPIGDWEPLLGEEEPSGEHGGQADTEQRRSHVEQDDATLSSDGQNKWAAAAQDYVDDQHLRRFDEMCHKDGQEAAYCERDPKVQPIS